MKFLTQKGTAQKIIIAIVFVVLFNFISPNITLAVTAGDVGGVLFAPIKALLLIIADSFIVVAQGLLFNIEESFITLNHSSVETSGGIAGKVGWLIDLPTNVIGGIFGWENRNQVSGLIGKLVGTVSQIALPKSLKLPLFILSPEEIFQNKIALLDVNFFSPNKYKVLDPLDTSTDTEQDSEEGSSQTMHDKLQEGKDQYNAKKQNQVSAALTLQPTISTWYYALRNLAIVALLSILVYVGIKIVISSSAEDKAKYKQKLIDWLVAMCLLFFMHYIMAFAVTVTEEVTKAINRTNSSAHVLIGNSDGTSEADDRNLSNYIYENSNGTKVFSGEGIDAKLQENGIIKDNKIEWPTNLMGKARIELQLEDQNISSEQVLMRQFGYTIIYVALVMYTVLFLFRYLKRLMMLAFLTIIAPLMAMTYPLDKMKDGSAQGFNTWLKEYIYNLLIQPVHLIIYTVLIGSAIDFAMNNLVYSLVALGFILQAEKLLRKFFGFDKASTVAGGSALGGALAMHGISQISKMLGKGSKGQKGGGKDASSNKTPGHTRKEEKGLDADALWGESSQPLESGDQSNTPENIARGQQMLDAYDEKFGTDEYDPSERETMARDLYTPSSSNDYGSKEEYAQRLREAGLEDDEIDNAIRMAYGDNLADTKPEPELEPKPAASSHTLPSPSTVTPVRTTSTASSIAPKDASEKRTLKMPKAAEQALKHAAYIAPRAAKFAAKTAVKGTVAGAGLAAGLAAGLVSDDFSNVLKYGAAGAGAGWIAGGGITGVPGAIKNTIDGISQAEEAEYAATHTQDEIDARNNALADMEFLRNKETIKLYQDKLGVTQKEAKQIMRQDAMKYRQYGITDDKTIIKAMKADQSKFGAERASIEKIRLAQLASEVTRRKDLDQIEKGLKQRGIGDTDIKKYTDAIKSFNNWA